MIGDQISPYAGWQEGAIISAQHVMAQITGKRTTDASMLNATADARRMLMIGV
jgi:hypothetical protein